MRKKVACSLAAALIVSATAAFGAVKEGSFTATPQVGGYVFDGGRFLDPTLVLGLRAGYNVTKNWGLEALYDYGIGTDGKFGPLKNVETHRFGAEVQYNFFPDNIFVPYLAGGLSGLVFKNVAMDDNPHFAIDYGVGAKYFLTDDFAIRGDLRHIFYGIDTKIYNDMEFTLGAYFQFGAPAPVAKAVAPEPTPPPAPAKAEPVPVPVAPADSDNDGVIDSLDKCPETPAGVTVDSQGCPVDTDKDGVADYLDKCPETPAGMAVDANGCPVDSDKDGVADYLDKCPETPAGVAVDASGCPVDSDKDGVPDYLDKCPETPAGVAVDAKGCSIEVAKKFCDKPAVIAISFDTGKADIKAKYYEELDKLGKFLKEFPNSKGTIAGHTDNVGNKASNMKLSQRRADSVRDYLLKTSGIAPERVKATGYGSSKPQADNKTSGGKAQNRRIEANFSCE